MPKSGGATDKIGNRYEVLWTIDCLLELIDEKANNIKIESICLNNLNEQVTAIRLEPVGEEGEGVEFWLQRENIREYHQVKRQNTKGRWALADLEGKQILTNFQKKLENHQAHCSFISINNAYELDELAERARSSQSWSEFVAEFLTAKEWLESFSKLVKYWHNYEKQEIKQVITAFKNEELSHRQQAIINIAEDSYKKLKSIYVETISERLLRQKVIVRLQSLIEPKSNDFTSSADYETAINIFIGLAFNSIHKTLTPSDIWKHLDTRGYQPCNYSKNTHVLTAINKANQLYLSPLEKQIVIAEQSIPREEVEEASNLLLNTQEKKGVLLIGEAGVGKSGVMVQIAKRLEQENIDFFVFRIDNLPPEVNPDDVGRKYGLPHSPASVLGNISKNQNRDWILIVDQLDAVSQVSGRNPQFFDCIYSLLEQTRQFPKVRVLVACRKFDLDNDSRLKNLIGDKGILETVEVKKLSSEQVKETVQTLGLNKSKLNQKQIDLLSVPLHLGLLAEISQEETIKTLNFETANDLFYKFWDYKQRKCRERISSSLHWTQVIDKLCHYMNRTQKQSLFAPKSAIDEYWTDAEIMISENILIQENKNIRFFHETFFDYAFARRFTEKGNELLSFLREDEQHLFKRAQVRQILYHERDMSLEQYLDNIEELLNSDDIRFHLKQLVISLLSSLENPIEEEWEIIKPFLKDNESSLVNYAWAILYKGQWFMFAKKLGIIKQWLEEKNDIIIDRTIRLMIFLTREFPDEITPLLAPFIEDISGKWLDRWLFIGENISSQLGNNRKILDLFLTLLDKGKLDNLKETLAMNGDFWGLISSLSRENSQWTCEVIGHYLNRKLQLYLIDILLLHFNYIYCWKINKYYLKQYTNLQLYLNPFERYWQKFKGQIRTILDTQHTDIFLKSAAQAPTDYVINVLPFMLFVIELTSNINNNGKSYEDNVWSYRSYGGGHGIDSAILKGMEIALSNLAKNNPEEFSKIIRNYDLLSSDSTTIQFLLIRAYTANGCKLAHEAVEYLCHKPYRLETGYSGVSDNSLSARFWASRQLIKAILPYCSSNHLDKLENLILNYDTFNNDWRKYHPKITINLGWIKARLFDIHLLSHYPQFICYIAINSYKANLFYKFKQLRKQTGYCQFILLDSMNDILIEQFMKLIIMKFNLSHNGFRFSRLMFLNTRFFFPSQRLIKRFFELQRKFISLGSINPTRSIKPIPIRVGFVGSPISQNATGKMIDEQWLDAIKKYDDEDGNRIGDLISGAYQLSSNLEKEVKKDPYRFANLIHKFPDNTNPYYFKAILKGIADAQVEIDIKTVLDICQHCHQLPQKTCGIEISRIIEQLAYLSWDQRGFDIITYYALHDFNPEQELWQTETSSGNKYYGGDILRTGINSVRGSATKAIAHLIFKDKERTVYFKKALQQMVKDPSLAVRSCVAIALTAVLNYDRDLAVNLFKQLVDTEDILLSTHTIDSFLSYALETHYTDLKLIVEKMINSPILEVQEIGAKRLFFVSLINPEAQPLAKKDSLAKPTCRKSAALIYSANIHLADYQETCKKYLLDLFYDKDKEVQRQASRCFLNLDNDNIADFSKLIENFIRSPAFLNNSDILMGLLKYKNRGDLNTFNAPFALNRKHFSLAFKICQTFLDTVTSQALDHLEGYSTTLQDISQIIVQIYSQTRDSKLQSDCLNVIDKLYLYRVYGLDKVTEEYDR